MKPIGRHAEASDATVVKALYSMKVGEISGILEVPAGLMCIKCVAIVPAEPGVAFDEKMQSALHAELSAKRLEQAVPLFFRELKEAAKPNLLLKGPPSAAEFREGVNHAIDQAGGVPRVPMGPVPAAPAPMKP